MKILNVIAVAVVLTILVSTTAQCANFLAVDWSGNILQIDSTTQVCSTLWYSGYMDLNCMARSSSGTIYSVSNRRLIEIDLITQTSTLIATLSSELPYPDFRAMAFSPDGVLYMVYSVADPDLGVVRNLCTVDISTGLTHAIGTIGRSSIQAIAFSSAGTLYGFDIGYGSGIGRGLITIDPATAVSTDVSPTVGTSISPSVGQALAFGPDGTLYSAHRDFCTVDTTTGTITYIMSTQYDIRGMVYVPEPSSIVAVLCGTFGLVAWRRKRE